MRIAKNLCLHEDQSSMLNYQELYASRIAIFLYYFTRTVRVICLREQQQFYAYENSNSFGLTTIAIVLYLRQQQQFYTYKNKIQTQKGSNEHLFILRRTHSMQVSQQSFCFIFFSYENSKSSVLTRIAIAIHLREQQEVYTYENSNSSILTRIA